VSADGEANPTSRRLITSEGAVQWNFGTTAEVQWQKAGEQCCNATVIVINVGPLQSQVAGQRLERFCSSPANHDEQHRTDYQHDLYQRSPLL
jgi:hypothetical protein